MGLSVAIKESTERFKSSASRSFTRLGSGRPKTTCRARLPTIRRDEREYMMGSDTTEDRLKLPDGVRVEMRHDCRISMAILYFGNSEFLDSSSTIWSDLS
jgi:hypothetical protein